MPRLLRSAVLLMTAAVSCRAFLPPLLPPTHLATTHTRASNTLHMSAAAPVAPVAPAAAATTTPVFVGSSLQDYSLAYEAAAKFVEGPVEFAPTSGGVNNVVQYVSLPDGRKFVMRLYNNGFDTPRVKWEHELLSQLNQQELSFKVPKPVASLEDPSLTHVVLSNGAEATMFEVIPGKLPKLTCVEDIGRAAGELSNAMQKLSVDPKDSPTPPYYDLYAVHHAVDRESFYREMASPPFDGVREAANVAVRDIEEMEKTIERCMELGLPKCLIHGDLHYDNILCDDGKVTGLLDFEFSAYDWRAMELAVCLSKYAGEKDAFPYFDQFITGFAQHGRLSMQEVEVIPDLVNLRILSNVVYFVGRAIAKEDDISSLTTRIENYNQRTAWVRANKQRIVDNIASKLAKAGGLEQQ